MERLTLTLGGVTQSYDIEQDEAKVHISLAEAVATFGLAGSDFELVPAAHAEGITDRDSETASKVA